MNGADPGTGCSGRAPDAAEPPTRAASAALGSATGFGRSPSARRRVSVSPRLGIVAVEPDCPPRASSPHCALGGVGPASRTHRIPASSPSRARTPVEKSSQSALRDADAPIAEDLRRVKGLRIR